MVENSDKGLTELLEQLQLAQNRTYKFDNFDQCLAFSIALNS